MAISSRLGPLQIPTPVLLTAARITSLLAAPVAVAAIVAGPPAALGMVAGLLGALPAAVMLPRAQAAGLLVPIALAAGVAVAVAGDPFPAAAFTALACLLIAPANAVANGLLTTLPTVTAILASVGADLDPAATGGWVYLGGLVAISVLRRPRGAQPRGIPWVSAWLHASVMAALVGASVYVVTLLEIPHGYWISLTLTSVLRPFALQTHQLARDRAIATVLGAAIALALAWVLAPWGIALVSIALLVATMSYTVLDRPAQAALASTPILVLVTGAAAGSATAIAAQRVIATAIGAVVSVAAAVLIDRFDPGRRDADRPAVNEPGAAPGPPAG